MTDTPVKFLKVLSSKPATFEPNQFVAVRVGTGFDLYLSDANGNVLHSQNFDATKADKSALGTAAAKDVGNSDGDVVSVDRHYGLNNTGWGGASNIVMTSGLTLKAATPVSGLYIKAYVTDTLGLEGLAGLLGTTSIAGTFATFGSNESKYKKYLFFRYGSNDLYIGDSHNSDVTTWGRIYHSNDNSIYNTINSVNYANVVVTPTGELQRSTKDIGAELDAIRQRLTAGGL